MTDTTYWTMIDSPLGPPPPTADENGISRVVMDADIDEQIAPSSGWIEDPSRFAEARRQLRGVLRRAAHRVRPSTQCERHCFSA